MKELQLNYNGILKYVSEEEIASYENQSKKALKDLRDKTGLGNDFTGWVNYPFEIQEREVNEICETAKKIRSESECLVVVGIGGSYLGAKAAIELLTPYFTNSDFRVFFIGYNVSTGYMNGLLNYLKDKDFSVNVVSKSGKTLEPAVAFHFIKELLIEKYGNKYNERADKLATSWRGL